MRPEVLATLIDAGGPKGDAFVTARLAGIGAAKRTAELIPLCHPLPLDRVEVEVTPEAGGVVDIRAEVAATARTGVEMEALTAASVAALTLYDMAKALQRDIVIESVRLVEKSGGRSGTFVADAAIERATHEAVVVTCSNRSAAGEREDASGPALVAALRDAGFDVAPEPLVVRDDEGEIAALLGAPGRCRSSARPDHRRHRADADRRHAGRDAARDRPRGARAGRADARGGRGAHPDGGAVARRRRHRAGRTLIANLPGSPKGATESLEALLPVLRHALEQLAGGDH